ncbi:MAG: hypothetical protein AB7V07_04735 [Candidatus Delongbacteria bacterium]
MKKITMMAMVLLVLTLTVSCTKKEEAVQKVENAVEETVPAVEEAAEAAADSVKEVAEEAVEAVEPVVEGE